MDVEEAGDSGGGTRTGECRSLEDSEGCINAAVPVKCKWCTAEASFTSKLESFAT